MAIELSTPSVDRLGAVVDALRGLQRNSAPIQLHPGDLGWHLRFGPDATAAALRTWSRGGQLLALGLLDGPGALRVTVAPEHWRDEELALRLATDASEPERGVLPSGSASIEAPDGTRLQDLLIEVGWQLGESWTPLRHDLSDLAPVGLRVEVVGPGLVPAFTAVHRSAWGSSRFTDEAWHTMASGLPFGDARCLLGYDEHDNPVAGVTIWSAGRGRPGLLEPMGVRADRRGRGHGTAICVAAASELKKMGSTGAMVCTPSSLTGAIATYRAAGFQQLPERLDRTRNA
ncbi:MAG: GNAT family N-acetyltransferase [Micropruina sp.]|uniref:GNAT family N-acetyltransferase n=1 Tax=Micropruina sp. TaxID=2737536 RepID=UPI0039E67061